MNIKTKNARLGFSAQSNIPCFPGKELEDLHIYLFLTQSIHAH